MGGGPVKAALAAPSSIQPTRLTQSLPPFSPKRMCSKILSRISCGSHWTQHWLTRLLVLAYLALQGRGAGGSAVVSDHSRAASSCQASVYSLCEPPCLLAPSSLPRKTQLQGPTHCLWCRVTRKASRGTEMPSAQSGLSTVIDRTCSQRCPRAMLSSAQFAR